MGRGIGGRFFHPPASVVSLLLFVKARSELGLAKPFGSSGKLFEDSGQGKVVPGN